jgi:pimeloyl-ACP methyl ester carboxylesterase
MIRNNSELGIIGAILALASRLDTTHVLSRIQIPTLLIVGEHDAMTSPSLMQAMGEKIPNAKLSVIPDAGHMSSLENPQVFNSALVQFLQSLE